MMKTLQLNVLTFALLSAFAHNAYADNQAQIPVSDDHSGQHTQNQWRTFFRQPESASRFTTENHAII